MPQLGSAWAAASNPLIEYTNQKEWSMATARLNSFCAAGLQVVGKLTVPSFSSWAPAARGKSRPRRAAITPVRMNVLLSHTSGRVVVPARARTSRATVDLRELTALHPCDLMPGRAEYPATGISHDASLCARTAQDKARC